MLAWECKEEIAIWGTGYFGRKLYFKYRHKYNIKYFIDNFPKEQEIDGVPVVLPQKEQNKKILIAVKDYEKICKQCANMGKNFGIDYLPYDFFEFTQIDIIRLSRLIKNDSIEQIFNLIKANKKIAIIVGNCQTEFIKRCLCKSDSFLEEYIWVDIPMIHKITCEDEKVLKNCSFVFEKCSLCITQIISDDNGFSAFLSTNSFLERLSPITEVIRIPALYFDIYFPQTIHQDKPITLLEEVGLLSFPYGDCVLDELAKSKYSSAEILEIVKCTNLFSREFLKMFFEQRMDSIYKKESKCDIKILDYILANYKKELLFYSKNHPSNKLIMELARRILKFIGYNDLPDVIDLGKGLYFWHELIYPSVATGYGLEFEKEMFMDAAFDEECSFEDMVKNYLSYVHNKK